MNEQILRAGDDARYGTFALIRRLLAEQGFVHWRRYAVAFALMALSAGCTAFSAYLIGDVINQAYVNRSLPGILILSGVTVALFTVKGIATYGHSVLLSRIGNRIVADNQRGVFRKLLAEGLGFFSDRHSTEFIARLSAGAAAATQVINLLITSFGRDLLSLIGLIAVMVVQDPYMSFFAFIVALVGCYFGMQTTGGTQGVGRSTTRAVVVASVWIFVLDFFITRFFVNL